MLKKKYKFTKICKFERVFRSRLLINKCYMCKYYYRNMADGKTLCISSGYEELNSICSNFYDTEFYYIYIPM